MRELPSLADDGLTTPIVGDWTEEKYRLIWCYADIFATSMKAKWQHRIYLDLFAGPGRARIRGTTRIVPAPPLLALNLKYPFTRYIFSEYDSDKLSALRQRAAAVAPNADVQFVSGDTNANVDRILELIPASGNVLTFCFADPYRLADLKFSTIEALARLRNIDFLFLIPSGMDANRNRMRYLKAKSEILDSFVGNNTWRDHWPAAKQRNQKFEEFVVDEFGREMAARGYAYGGVGSAHPMISTRRKLLIYHLLMLSRHPLGANFWEKCRASSTSQKRLF